MATEQTRIKQRKMATGFYARHFPDGDMTPAKLADKLTEIAGDYRPDSWRNLRNAIAFDQRENGFSKAADRVHQTQNPCTMENGKAKPKAERRVKQRLRQCRKVPDEDLKRLLTATKHKRPDLHAAIVIAYATGCRPSEMRSIRQLPGGEFYIAGAKKRASGDRGIDRKINVSPKMHKPLTLALQTLAASDKDPLTLAKRMHEVSRETFPGRKIRPTLKSFRHQMGSDLKALCKSGEMTRAEAAYILGHQSTDSIIEYGNSRSSRGRSPDVSSAVSVSEIAKVVREGTNSDVYEPRRQSKKLGFK